MACLRLLTLPPLPPLPRFSLPFFLRCMARFTSLPALLEYFLAIWISRRFWCNATSPQEFLFVKRARGKDHDAEQAGWRKCPERDAATDAGYAGQCVRISA